MIYHRSLIQILLFSLLLIPQLVTAQWIKTNWPYQEPASCFFNNGSEFIAGSASGIFRYADSGNDWSRFDSGGIGSLSGFLAKGSTLFAYDRFGVYRSSDGGGHWQACDSGLTSNEVRALASSNDKLFLGTDNGMFVSTNNGNNWTLTYFSGCDVVGLVESNGILTIGIDVWGWDISPTHSYPNSVLINQKVDRSIRKESVNQPQSFNTGIYFSANDGIDWTFSGTFAYASTFAICDSTIFACGELSLAYRSTTNGETWDLIGGLWGKEVT